MSSVRRRSIVARLVLAHAAVVFPVAAVIAPAVRAVAVARVQPAKHWQAGGASAVRRPVRAVCRFACRREW